MNTMFHIGFDARYLSHGLVGGVHTYVRQLVGTLSRRETQWRWTFYADTKAPFELTELPPTVKVRLLPWRNAASSVLNDFQLGQLMRREGVTLAHFPANYGFAPANLPLVITVHDAINVLPLRDILRGHPKHPRQQFMMTYLHLLTTAAMRRTPMVITDSEYSRREILRRTGLADDRVRVVYLAPDPSFRLLDAACLREWRARWRLRERVVLADGTKNPDCTLRAFRALPAAVRARTSLVFFARRLPPPAAQRAAEAGECLLLLCPPHEELVALYNLADLFIFPSWYEGFGLPVLEAMACGAPVIASSRGSLPEVTGDGGLIVDAEDHDAIARATVDLLTNEVAYARLREQALAWTARFSWEKTATQTLQVYGEAFLNHSCARQSRRRHRVSI